MKTCHTCGNPYSNCFEIKMADKSYAFDCFECAIHALAPVCQHCGCKIIGHGCEQESRYYCCEHCANAHAPNPG